jgi:hypothetical protein
MKKILIGLIFLYSNALLGQELINPEIIFGRSYQVKQKVSTPESALDVQNIEKEPRNELQGLLFAESKMNESSPWGISILFVAQTDGWMEGLVGPAYMRENFSLGCMFGFENVHDMWRVSSWGTFSSKNKHFSGLLVFETGATGRAQKAELLYCMNPRGFIKTSIGGYLHGDRAGPTIRFTSKRNYLFIAPYMYGFATNKETLEKIPPSFMIGFGMEIE